MRTALAIPALILLAGLGTAAAATRPPALSWGKAGVSYTDYRADATACLRVAAGTDLTGTEPANALALASRQIETDFTLVGADPIATANAIEQARITARPDLRIRQARDILQARLDHCLQQRGYQRFRLTDEQRRRLNHFSLRQQERQVYLHSLASDPQVLASQSADALPAR